MRISDWSSDVCSSDLIDIFDRELIRDMGRYIYRVYIGNGNNFVNFADAPARMNARAGLIYRYGQAIDDPTMAGFGRFLLSRYQAGATDPSGSLAPAFGEPLALQDWAGWTSREPFCDESSFTYLNSTIVTERDSTNQR